MAPSNFHFSRQFSFGKSAWGGGRKEGDQLGGHRNKPGTRRWWLVQTRSGGAGEKWCDSGCTLKVEGQLRTEWMRDIEDEKHRGAKFLLSKFHTRGFRSTSSLFSQY